MCCNFVKINDRFAAKLYEQAGIRDGAWRLQKALAIYYLAPDAGERFDLPVDPEHDRDKGPQFRFGYVTEIVQTFVPHERDRNQSQFKYLDKFGKEFPDQFKKAQEDRDRLQANLSAVGYDWDDRHLGNIGYKDGRVVLIDTDPFTLYEKGVK